MADDAAFYAAAAAATDAAERRSTLGRLTRELQEHLKANKKARQVKHGGTGGRMNSEAQAIEDDLKARLLRVNMGLLPGEDLPAKAPSDAVLMAAAARHPADHAPQVRRVAAAAAAAPPAAATAAAAAAAAPPNIALPAAATAAAASAVAGGDDPDHDDLLEVEGESEGEEGARANGGAAAAAQPAASVRSKRKATGKAPLLPVQQREIEKNVRTVVEGRADRFEFAPPHPTMARKFSAVLFCLLPVIVWLPHLLWSHCGVPPQPPCPVHGFDCNVTQHGKKLAPPRRFVGLFLERCGWLVGSVHKCDKCMEAYLERKTNGTLRKTDHYFFFARPCNTPPDALSSEGFPRSVSGRGRVHRRRPNNNENQNDPNNTLEGNENENDPNNNKTIGPR